MQRYLFPALAHRARWLEVAFIAAVLLVVAAPAARGAETRCATLEPAPAGRACAVTPGTASGLLLQGDVLAPGMVFRGGGVRVEADGTIGCAGCGCAAGDATVVRCPAAVISPGLINSLDHITFSQNLPAVDTGERYEQRHDWRQGLRGHTQLQTSGGASTNQLRWAELRQLISGTTSISSSGGVAGLARNLDNAVNQQLGVPQQRRSSFPLGDTTSGSQLLSGCAYPDITTPAEIADFPAWLALVGEGIDAVARNEFLCVSGLDASGQDLLLPQTVLGKSVALRQGDYALLAARGGGVVWSPRSNLRLYGDTARLTSVEGLPIALGTDWTPTGSMNLLRELACADSFSRDYLGGRYSAQRLWEMATREGAALAAVGQRIGSIQAGLVADLAVFDASVRADHRAVVGAQAADVLLVLRAGRVMYGEAATVAEIPGTGACDALAVCGAARAACVADEIGQQTVAQLEAALGGGAYPLFFCGVPTDEPTCIPARPVAVGGASTYDGTRTPDDPDGDGIRAEIDNCPTVFNPERPGDTGQQDADADGLGDECDPLDVDVLFRDGYEPSLAP